MRGSIRIQATNEGPGHPTIALHSTPRCQSVCISDARGAARVSAALAAHGLVTCHLERPPSFGDLTTCPQGKIRYAFYMSVKEQVLQAIQRLPDDIDFRDVADEIALLAAVREAERDIEQGRLISNAEMRSRIAEWNAS